MKRNIINQLVEELMQLSEQFSPWEYSDCLSEFPNYPTLLAEQISTGDTACIINTLRDFADMASDAENGADYQRIQSLIDRIRNIQGKAA